MILRLNRKSIRDLPAYLIDTWQAAGYTFISHPFSWVISQLVTRRDWFRLIRILPYGVARLNRFHWCVVFLPPPHLHTLRAPWYLVPIHTDRTHTRLHDSHEDYSYWCPIRNTVPEFLVFFIGRWPCLPVGRMVYRLLSVVSLMSLFVADLFIFWHLLRSCMRIMRT